METLKIKNPKIIEFYKKYKNLDFEKVNLIIIELYEEMINNISGEFNKHITSEILSTIKTHGIELDSFKNELNTIMKSNIDIYKTEISNIKTIQTLTNTNIISEINTIKDIINKLNVDITNSIISKFYDIRKEYTNELEILITKNGSDTLLKIIDKIEKEHEQIINKTNTIMKEVIPTSQNQIYNQHDIIIKNFKDDLTKNIDIIKNEIKENKSDISLDKLNLLVNEKYNMLVCSVEKNVLNYITTSEERLKTNINTIKDDKTLKELKEDINNIKNDITSDKLSLSNNIQQTVLNYISTSEERLKNNLNEIKDLTNNNQTSQEKLNLELQNFLNQYKISSKKGEFGEKLLESILTSLFPSSEIINTTGHTSSGDFILKRENKVQILFENKNYDSVNVPKKEVDKFIYDIENNNCCGIMMSQKSGIALKNNFQIDINNNNILIYIHNMNYDPEKILLACDIIDNLTNKIKQLNNNDTTTEISNNTLQIINEQYQRFINKKDAILYQINDNTKKIIESIKELEIGELNNILLNTFTNTKINNFKCELCNIYIGATNKSLSNHKRYCKHKIILDENSTDDNSSEKSLNQNSPDIKLNEESNKKVSIKNKKNNTTKNK